MPLEAPRPPMLLRPHAAIRAWPGRGTSRSWHSYRSSVRARTEFRRNPGSTVWSSGGGTFRGRMGRAMSPVPAVPVTDLDDPRIADYRDVSDAVLLERRGLFVAEGRLVVRRLLDGGRYTVRSLLVTPAALAGLDKGDSDTGDGSFVRE